MTEKNTKKNTFDTNQENLQISNLIDKVEKEEIVQKEETTAQEKHEEVNVKKQITPQEKIAVFNTKKDILIKSVLHAFTGVKKCIAEFDYKNVTWATFRVNTIQASTICIYALSVILLAWALPQMYGMLFEKEVAKTAIFFSPTDKKMVYTEQLRIDDPMAMQKSENHHADVAYKDEDGNYFTREEFEAKIPFLYFRNMEMRGLLPLEIDGQSYDRARIEKHRRVLELNARQLDHKKYEEAIYPLLEANPNQVALVLPTDRFRMTSNAMQFIDSDINAPHKELTESFTNALKAKDFTFPAKGVWGNFTIFKPYDAGVFVLDAKGKTYHIIRKNNKPEITLVPFENGIVPEKITIAETNDKQLYGLLLDTKDKVHIFHTKNYALTHIPTPKYNSENMDFKVLLDPIYVTALYSDNERSYAIAYPYDFSDNTEALPKELTALHSYDMIMSRTQMPFYSYVSKIIFPFTISLNSEDNAKNVFDIQFQGVYSFLSLFFSILLMCVYREFCKRKKHNFSCKQGTFIVIFGLYALIPILLMEEYRKR